jgi:hypothetical protein
MPNTVDTSPFPPSDYTMDQRVALFEEAETLYTKIFKAEGEARNVRLKDQLYDADTEQIWFDNISLEINDEPSFYMVDYYLRPIVGPRLELHLQGSIGIHDAKVQLGRIARYIDRRQLTEGYANISATTSTPLARAANFVTGIPPAVTLYIPDREEGDNDANSRFSGALDSHNQFLEKHGRPQITQQEASYTSLVVATEAFVHRWRDHKDSSFK